jgi:hypothetical protein
VAKRLGGSPGGGLTLVGDIPGMSELGRAKKRILKARVNLSHERKTADQFGGETSAGAEKPTGSKNLGLMPGCPKGYRPQRWPGPSGAVRLLPKPG